jgi:hypothetical protein
VLAELKQAQESANQAIQAMLAKTIELQRAAAEHLTQETEHAAKLRADTLAEAERIKLDASADAEKIIDRARHQAAAIDNRARQELALRRRQMRDEQDLLNRRKHAMLNQLTSLSALAVETAENLPDVPEVPDSEFDDIGGSPPNGVEMESDPTLGNAAVEPGEQRQPEAASVEIEPRVADEPEHAEGDDDQSSAVDERSAGDKSSAVSSRNEGTSEQPPGDQDYEQAPKPSAA